MSRRTRSVENIEGRILDVLGRVKNNKYPTNLSLSAIAMKYELQSVEEQHNFDYALYNLLREGVVVQEQDEDGFKVFRLAA